MAKRMMIMLGAMLVLIAALGLVKFLQIRAAIAQGSSWQPPPEAVTTVVATRRRSGRPRSPRSARWRRSTA